MMKNVRLPYLIFIYANLLNFLPAQNWQLINPDYHYHYVDRDSMGQGANDMDAYTIRIDSIIADTAYLNRWFPDDLDLDESYIASEINLPHFLQKEFIQMGNEEIRFRNPGDLRLPAHLETGVDWLFDSQANIHAQLDSVFVKNMYEVSDSVKAISLSTGDRILLSKSYGILQWPNGYGQKSYYRQIGISGPDVGFTFPRYEDFFNYAPGDQFEYLIEETIDQLGNGADDKSETKTSRVQFEILDTMSVDGQLRYKMQTKECMQRIVTKAYDPTHIFSTSSFFKESDKWDTIDTTPFPHWIEKDEQTELWDVYPHESVVGNFPGPYLTPVSTVVFSTNYSCQPGLERSILFLNCSLPWNDSFMECERNPATWVGQIHWVEGMGLVSEYARSDESSYRPRKTSRKLIASRISGYTCGIFTDMTHATCSFDPPGDPEESDDKKFTFAYTNPVIDQITIGFPHSHEVTHISLVDLNGRLKYEQPVKDDNEIKIDVGEWITGVYLLTLRNRKSKIIEWRKIVVL